MNTSLIAVPTRFNLDVDDHFGHCAQYSLFAADAENRVQEAGTLPSPQGCGCKSNIASVLQQKGVSVLLAGNMGPGAVSMLQRHGIQVHRGCSGNARKAVEAFLAGQWKDSGVSCEAHHHSDPGHQCSSGH
jgi:predicted Fe-Mo cluster-binding NifX family protein